jgi:NAD(P)-dependent dehydrogenase (short-subunit alcohol dehydrogenase family)
MDFTDKVAVITGGARGLGLAYAKALAKRGARVVLGDAGADNSGQGSDASVVQQAAQALDQQGFQARAHQGEYSQEADCQSLITMAVEAFGGVDIIIHNAGWVDYQPIEQTDGAFLERALGINVYAPLWLCKHGWPHLKRSACPRVVLTTSDRAMFAKYAQVGLAGYAAGKMAQIGIMNALALEGKPAGILVNAISPVAKTRMWGVQGTPTDLTPESVVPGVLYLASGECHESGYVLRASNGQFTATRFVENQGVDYPLDLARIAVENAEDFTERWPQIKER